MPSNTYVYRYRQLATYGLLVLVLIGVHAQAQVSLGLSPMRLEFAMAPGQQQSGTVNLSNDAGGKVRIRAELLDFLVDNTATPQFERDLPSEAPFSCRSWLSLNPMEIEISGRTPIPVRFTLRVPEGVKEGSYHCAAGFVTLPPAEEAKATGLRMAVRVVAAFYVVIGHPPIDGILKQIQLEASSPGQQDEPAWQAVVLIENRGRMHFRPTGTLTVLDANDQVMETVELKPLPVLPVREQRFLLPLKTDVQSGGYKLRARVDLGAGEIQQAIVQIATHTGKP
jgi:hypothetical protein